MSDSSTTTHQKPLGEATGTDKKAWVRSLHCLSPFQHRGSCACGNHDSSLRLSIWNYVMKQLAFGHLSGSILGSSLRLIPALAVHSVSWGWLPSGFCCPWNVWGFFVFWCHVHDNNRSQSRSLPRLNIVYTGIQDSWRFATCIKTAHLLNLLLNLSGFFLSFNCKLKINPKYLWFQCQINVTAQCKYFQHYRHFKRD